MRRQVARRRQPGSGYHATPSQLLPEPAAVHPYRRPQRATCWREHHRCCAACRGAHTFFLRQGEVPRWGGYTVNLIHYEDAAGLCLAALQASRAGSRAGRRPGAAQGHSRLCMAAWSAQGRDCRCVPLVVVQHHQQAFAAAGPACNRRGAATAAATTAAARSWAATATPSPLMCARGRCCRGWVWEGRQPSLRAGMPRRVSF